MITASDRGSFVIKKEAIADAVAKTSSGGVAAAMQIREEFLTKFLVQRDNFSVPFSFLRRIMIPSVLMTKSSSAD